VGKVGIKYKKQPPNSNHLLLMLNISLSLSLKQEDYGQIHADYVQMDGLDD